MQIIVDYARDDGDDLLMKQHSDNVNYLTYQTPVEAPAAANSHPASLPVTVRPWLTHTHTHTHTHL